MARADGSDDALRKGEAVLAASALPGVPEGTKGRVVLSVGLTWIRYWVRFDNGVERGSIHRAKLARPSEWDELVARRARGEEAKAEAPAEAAAAVTEDAAAPPATGAASRVPAHLLERSRKAREKASAGG
jgi:hypothetical protein